MIQENAFDFERLNELFYYVQAKDMLGAPESRSSTVVLRISVQNVNDEPPKIELVIR